MSRETLPYYVGPRRQRGSGIGALAAGVSTVAVPLIQKYAIPFVRKHVLPRAIKFGKDLAYEAGSEIKDVIGKKKTARHAVRDSFKRAAKRQIGSGRSAQGTKKRKPSKSRITKRKKSAKRSRSDFFSNINKNDR